MKKTLLALALLLGTGGAFAQIGIKADAVQSAKKTTLDKGAFYQELRKQKQSNLNTRKDGEALTLLCDFSNPSDYSFTVGSLDGVGVGLSWTKGDTNVGFGSNGTQAATFFGVTNGGRWYLYFNPARYEITPSGANGFAFLSWLDIQAQGSHRNTSEAIINFSNPIETYGMEGLDIHFNQMLQRFNSERYFIDWSNDANFSTYDSIEFNIRGIELNSNDFTLGTKRVTLPRGTENANSVATSSGQQTYVRIRAYAPASQDQPQGYVWIVDDVHYSEVPEDRIDVLASGYYRNAYYSIPVGVMPDTLVHITTAENTGGTPYYDLVARNVVNKVSVDEQENTQYTYYGANASDGDTLVNEMTRVITYNNATPPVPIDTTEQRYTQMYAWSNHLPYQEEGRYSISTILTSGENTVSELGDTTYFSVVGQMDSHEGHYRWSKDRGMIAKYPSGGGGTFTYGRTAGGLWTDWVSTGLAGYEVCLPYGANNDNASVKYITGIEVVPAVDSCRAGAKIQGKLRMFNTRDQQVSYDNMVIDVEDEWGVPVETPVYTLQEADLNNGSTVWEMLDDGWGIGYSNINTVYMEFPNSVRLEPGEIYYACYRMAETGKFAVATDRYFANTFGPGNGWAFSVALLFQSNVQGYGWGGTFAWGSVLDNTTPMIRMILGDAASLPEQISSTSSLNAYPNPSNGETTISYSLNKSGNVNIVITDMMGRTVKTINQGNQVAGTSYNVNLSTSDLANGTYFYTLSVNGEKQTKKLVVNK